MTPPLAERLRPTSFDEIAGQDHLVGKEGWLKRIILSTKPLSILLYGPPGSGKTTLAKLYAQAFSAPFVQLSAIFSGVSELKKIFSQAQESPLFHKQLVLFVDEIHRFNKAQQDAFLPFIEDGTIILVGATTENPSFVLNNALLSRLRVLNLKPLDLSALDKILQRYETKSKALPLTPDARQYLIEIAQGDGRHLLNMIENLETSSLQTLDLKAVQELLQRRSPLYDRQGEGHYNLISALHKSIRGSDPDASLYWLNRILEGGEDPLYIARRLIRIASEDIGLADPFALELTLRAREAYNLLGSPEGELAIAQAVVYLSLAPKSNALYVSFNDSKEFASKTNHLPPPPWILNAPTKLMKEMGYGKGYVYDHDTKEGFSGQEYFPKEVAHQNFYEPKNIGFEREMKKRVEYFQQLRRKKGTQDS